MSDEYENSGKMLNLNGKHEKVKIIFVQFINKLVLDSFTFTLKTYVYVYTLCIFKCSFSPLSNDCSKL